MSGATASGRGTDLRRVFFLQMKIIGSTMGTRSELEQMLRFMAETGVRPTIDRVLPLSDARDGLAAMAEGELFGKIVLSP